MRQLIPLLILSIQSFAADTASTIRFVDTTFWLTKQQRKEIRLPHYLEKQGFVVASAFVAGWFDGENHFLRNNFEYYQERWPNTNPQWSNPRLSSYNKYKGGREENGPAYTILGLRSDKALAFATDKWHLNEFLDMFLLGGSCAASMMLYGWPKGTKWWRIVIRAVGQGTLIHAAHSLGKYACFEFYRIQ